MSQFQNRPPASAGSRLRAFVARVVAPPVHVAQAVVKPAPQVTPPASAVDAVASPNNPGEAVGRPFLVQATRRTPQAYSLENNPYGGSHGAPFGLNGVGQHEAVFNPNGDGVNGGT